MHIMVYITVLFRLKVSGLIFINKKSQLSSFEKKLPGKIYENRWTLMHEDLF